MYLRLIGLEPGIIKDGDRGPFFSFQGLVKSGAQIIGIMLPSAELIDKSQFESTVYTDSINRIAKMIKKPEISVSSAVSSDNVKLKPGKSMDVDQNEDTVSNSSDRDIYGSILDLNPDFSISEAKGENGIDRTN